MIFNAILALEAMSFETTFYIYTDKYSKFIVLHFFTFTNVNKVLS